jgi:HTH-type transcriptional regulator/antitoxin MqsA
MNHVCLNCEIAEMEKTTKDVTVSFGNFSEPVPAIYGWHCPHCGEIEFLDKEGSDRYQAALERVSALAQAKREAEGQGPV